MKIYQIHEWGGEWEDRYDYIVSSYLSKEKAEAEKERLEKEQAGIMKCNECPIYFCPFECNGEDCGTAWNDELYGVSILDKCPECNAIICTDLAEHLEREEQIYNADIDEAMIRAANKAVITSHQLLDVLVQQGVMGVYNLGLKHMYEYLEK